MSNDNMDVAPAAEVIQLHPAKAKKASERKWGKPVMDLGFCIIPSLLLRAQARLGLNPTQLAVLMTQWMGISGPLKLISRIRLYWTPASIQLFHDQGIARRKPSVSASSPAPALSRFLGAGLHLSQPSHFRGQFRPWELLLAFDDQK